MEHAIETEVGRLAVFEEELGPVLFFWPSLYLDHRSFEAVVVDLASERRCVVVDGPGHGRSPGPDGLTTWRPAPGRRCRCSTRWGSPRSTGSATPGAAPWAFAPPSTRQSAFDRSSRSARPCSRCRRRCDCKRGCCSRCLRLGMADRVGALVAGVMLPAERRPLAARREVRRVVREAPRAALMETIRSISIRRGRSGRRVGQDRVPDAVRCGRRRDAMWPPDVAAAQASRIPGARSVTLPGQGTSVPSNGPARPPPSSALISERRRGTPVRR